MSTSDGSCNRLALVSAPPDARNYTPRKNSVNDFVRPRAIYFAEAQLWHRREHDNFKKQAYLTLFGGVPILQSPQSRHGQVAQLVERGPEKAGVGGSIPSLATI
jgi:hypothetical protein